MSHHPRLISSNNNNIQHHIAVKPPHLFHFSYSQILSKPSTPNNFLLNPQNPKPSSTQSSSQNGLSTQSSILLLIGYSVSTTTNSPCGGIGILGIVWAFGGMIFVLVYCTAGISGNHINPIVTFGLFEQCVGTIVEVGLARRFWESLYEENDAVTNVVA